MAEKVIGVDIGTSGIRVVEMTFGDRPRVLSFGQVPLASGAVHEGEVVDVAAVASALRTLWKELGLKSRTVRVAIASPRVIVRPVEMPPLSDGDMRAALRFQLGDYIPLPPEATFFDFQELHGAARSGRERQVLLAAAPREAVQPLVEAVRQAGLRPAHVDVAAVSLARVLAYCVPTGPPPPGESNAIVSIGAQTVVVTIVEDGLPIFARTVTNSSGGQIADRIAAELGVPVAEAGQWKRRLPAGTPPETASRLVAITDPVVNEIISEIGDSLDYFGSQAPDHHPDSITVAGSAAALLDIEERLERRLLVPVHLADPVHGGGAAPATRAVEEWESLAPVFALAMGTALGAERGAGRQINLLADSGRRPLTVRRPLVIGGVAAIVVAIGAYLALGQSRALSSAKAERAQVEQQLTAARQHVLASGVATAQGAAADTSATAILQNATSADIDWADVVQRLDTVSEPLGVTIASFSATGKSAATNGVSHASKPSTPTPTSTTTPATTTVPGAGVAVVDDGGYGTVSVSGSAPDLYAVAAWIDAVTADDGFVAAWVDSTTADSGTNALDFTASVSVSKAELLTRPNAPGASS